MKKIYEINQKIYPISILKNAIKDFLDVSNITYDKWHLKIEWNTIEEIEEIFNEFMNYCIWLIDEK